MQLDHPCLVQRWDGSAQPPDLSPACQRHASDEQGNSIKQVPARSIVSLSEPCQLESRSSLEREGRKRTLPEGRKTNGQWKQSG